MTRQPNFGHAYSSGFGVFIDSWGSGPLLIRYGERKWFFEFSDMFGPLLLSAKSKEPLDRQPTSDTDPFWDPFNRWMMAGKKCRAVRNSRGRVIFFLCHVPRYDALE